MRHLYSLALVSLLLLNLTGCATTSSLVPKYPKMSIAAVKPTKVGITGQQFAFTLKAVNPNSFNLPISATDFVATFNGQEVAKGVTTQNLSVPANGSSDIVLNIDTNLMSSMTGVWKKIASGTFDFNYQLSGNLKIDFGIAPFTVPYNLKGNLLDSVKLTR